MTLVVTGVGLLPNAPVRGFVQRTPWSALPAQVALVQLITEDQEVEQVYGVQPHHLLCCDALGLDRAGYEAPSAQKNDRCIQTP
jgi:hypothetical protein